MPTTTPRNDGGLWGEILSSVSQKQSKNRTLLVLGDRESGKSKLISKMKGLGAEESNSGGVSLEFDFIDIRDPDDLNGEILSRLDVWTVNHTKGNLELLRSVLTHDSLFTQNQDGQFLKSSCLALITVDLSRPRQGAESIAEWVEGLEGAIASILKEREIDFKLMQKSNLDYANEFRLTDGFKETVEESIIANAPHQEGLFVKNIGIPLVLVGTKSDMLKEHDSELVQQALRTIAMTYGAALVYTSADWKDETIETLMQYVTHRLYGFEYRTEAEDVAKDQIFIPLGWDTKEKIKAVFDGPRTLKDISQPVQEGSRNVGAQIQPIDHQKFLESLREKSEKRGARKEDREILESQLDKGAVTNYRPTQSSGNQDITMVVPSQPGAGAPRRQTITAPRNANTVNVAADFFGNILKSQGQKSEQTKEVERFIREKKNTRDE